MTIQKSAKWERKTAKGAKKAGPPEFSGSEPCKLTVEMFFDASGTQDGSVVEAVEKLFSCCVPTEESRGKNKPSPPLVVLHWGEITSFPAFVTQVSAKYTLFSARTAPRSGRSAASSMEEMPGEPGQAEPDVRRPVRAPRAHDVAGDSLASLAYARVRRPDAVARRSPRTTASTTRMRLPPGSACCSRLDDLLGGRG